MGVARLQRIERPFNQPDIAAQSFIALEKLEHTAYAAVAIIGAQASHVRVQKRSAIANGRERQRKTYESVSVVGAKNLTAGASRNDKQRCRLDFQLLLS